MAPLENIIINSEFGVLQGGMISPKLFREFLQDIHLYMKKDNGELVCSCRLTLQTSLAAEFWTLCKEEMTFDGHTRVRLDGLVGMIHRHE